MNMIDQIKNWPFLQEPLWRWAIFAGAMLAILAAWYFVLEYMKD